MSLSVRGSTLYFNDIYSSRKREVDDGGQNVDMGDKPGCRELYCFVTHPTKNSKGWCIIVVGNLLFFGTTIQVLDGER